MFHVKKTAYWLTDFLSACIKPIQNSKYEILREPEKKTIEKNRRKPRSFFVLRGDIGVTAVA